MKKKTINIITALTFSIILLAANGFADIPAPVVNQSLGTPDSVLNNLEEADCRLCHENNTVDPTSIPDRHHMLYSDPILKGKCQNSGDVCITDADCTGLNETCTGQTVAPFPYADPTAPILYVCLTCHEDVTNPVTGAINFTVERDCLECHVQVDGEASVHHLTATAQGTDSPLGDPTKGDCTPCHGTLVDDYGDDAIIPTYEPSMVTPTVNKGTAAEINIEGSRAGSCVYCHSSGTGTNWPGIDSDTGILVYRNGTLHHSAGVDRDRNGDPVNGGCTFCHGSPINLSGDSLALRNCEQCHGYESLHNIQADSQNPDNVGDIVVGGEDYGYGHVGRDAGSTDSDCWGCHGFGFNSTSAPAAGPVTPYLSDSNEQVIFAGTDTTIIVSGSSLTNYSGTTELTSFFTLSSRDGLINIGLSPEQINKSSATLIIPGTTPAGNYKLYAVKGIGGIWTYSNPVSIIIKEPMVIESQTMTVNCGIGSGEVTIIGSGFGIAPPEGSELYMNVMQSNVKLDILIWTDTKIIATGALDGTEITVNGLFDSATK